MARVVAAGSIGAILVDPIWLGRGWLWQNWLALGKVCVLAGDGGKGKSTVLCDWAARTTKGDMWPDFTPGGRPGGVIILAAEDDVEDTLAPRLMAAGADTTRIFSIRSVRTDELTRRTFSLQADLTRLEAEIKSRDDIKLVIIDPISSYLGKVDSHNNAEVRTVLEPLGEMAARMRVSVICNNHFSKSGGNATHRIIGSVAFVNQARAAFIVTPDADDENRLLLMPAKMNIAPIKNGLAYRIGSAVLDVDGQKILTSQIVWETEPITITANDALAALAVGDEAKTAKSEAIEFLEQVLSTGGKPASEVQAEARSAGIQPKALRSAREALGIKPEKLGFTARMDLAAPEGAQHAPRCPVEWRGIFGLLGHLRGCSHDPPRSRGGTRGGVQHDRSGGSRKPHAHPLRYS